MKKRFVSLPFMILVAASVVHASDVGFDVNINIGNNPRPVAVPPPPPHVVVPPPPVVLAPPPRVIIEQPPVFLLPPALGFYAAVGVPYDLFYASGTYYLHRGNGWFRASAYNGPWVEVSRKRLPPGLRRHRFEKIRHYRDQEYQVYQGGREYYRGRHFQPDRDWKERRKEEREQWKDEKREEKEERKRHKHHRDHD